VVFMVFSTKKAIKTYKCNRLLVYNILPLWGMSGPSFLRVYPPGGEFCRPGGTGEKTGGLMTTPPAYYSLQHG
jgi:hypothetical protein